MQAEWLSCCSQAASKTPNCLAAAAKQDRRSGYASLPHTYIRQMHGVAHSVPLVPRQLVLPNQPKACCQLRGRRETHAHTTLRGCQPPVLGRQPLCCPFATESGHAMHAVRWPRGRPCHPTAIWVVPEIEDQVRLQPGVCPKRSRPQFAVVRQSLVFKGSQWMALALSCCSPRPAGPCGGGSLLAFFKYFAHPCD